MGPHFDKLQWSDSAFFVLPTSSSLPSSNHMTCYQSISCAWYRDCQLWVNGRMGGYSTDCSIHLGELNRQATTSWCVLTWKHNIFIFSSGEVACVSCVSASWEHLPNKPGSRDKNNVFSFYIDLFHCCLKEKKDGGTSYPICATTKNYPGSKMNHIRDDSHFIKIFLLCL